MKLIINKHIVMQICGYCKITFDIAIMQFYAISSCNIAMHGGITLIPGVSSFSRACMDAFQDLSQ